MGLLREANRSRGAQRRAGRLFAFSRRKVVSDLMRQGLELQIEERNGIPVFRVPSSAKPITSERIREAEDAW